MLIESIKVVLCHQQWLFRNNKIILENSFVRNTQAVNIRFIKFLHLSNEKKMGHGIFLVLRNQYTLNQIINKNKKKSLGIIIG